MNGRSRSCARPRASAALVLLAASLSIAACAGAFSRKYEYEEDVYLDLDGSAVVYVNASVPALVALRGVDLPLDPTARLDRNDVRAIYESPAAEVASVSLSRRDNRRYVHLRLDVPDITRLSASAPFAWSTYTMGPGEDDGVEYRQRVAGTSVPDVGAGLQTRPDLGNVGWTGDELVAFRLHLPSRISFENSESSNVQRGNIVVWEQPLEARRRDEPVDIRVVMERESILSNTLTLFGMMIALAGLTFAVVIWLVIRRGRSEPADHDSVPAQQPKG